MRREEGGIVVSRSLLSVVYAPRVFPGKVKEKPKVCNASIFVPCDYFTTTEKLMKNITLVL